MDQQKIEILISTSIWDPQPWVDGLIHAEYISKVHTWPTNDDLTNVSALFVWKPLAQGVTARLPNLKWISSLGAGVDHLMTDPQIPNNIAMTRIVDPRLTVDMTNYVMMAVVMHQRNFSLLQANQAKSYWERITYANLRVGVMGLGELGGYLAKQLQAAGFDTFGYSRTKNHIPGVETYAENGLDEFLSELDVLVNLLPITPKTIGILNKDLLSKTKKGCYLINVARGNHLVEEDLIELLDSGHLSGAMLDVFHQEPLPKEHPFWKHAKITITPHVASVTSPESALSLLKVNIQKLVNQEPLLHQVDLDRGY